MEILTLTPPVTKEDFWLNFCQLKYQCNVPFPLDQFSYKCDCDQDIILCKNGHYYLDGPVSSLVERLIEDKILLQKQHLDEAKCGSASQALKINEAVGMPENLIVFLNESNIKDVTEFEMEESSYEPILVTVSSGGPVLALYRKRHSDDETYLNFLKHNFETG